MIIGVTGNLGAGKDTVGAYLVNAYGFRRIGFADKLKESAAALFDVPVESWEEWKNNRRVRVVIETERYINAPAETAAALTAREFLQRYGTEAHREVFGYDFWVEQALKVTDLSDDNFVVTDCRFDNEAEAIKKRGGIVIRVYRPGTGGDEHASEKALPEELVDYTLINDKSKGHLYIQIDTLIQEDLAVDWGQELALPRS